MIESFHFLERLFQVTKLTDILLRDY